MVWTPRRRLKQTRSEERKIYLVKPLKNTFLQNYPFGSLSSSCISIVASTGDVCPCWRTRMLFVTTAYQRVSMGTAGAYRLIDAETGENFVVRGGVDGEAPMPSQEVLSWKTKEKPGEHDGQKILSGSHESFGRLKVSKARALVKNSLVGVESSRSGKKGSAGAMLLREADSVHSRVEFAREAARADILRDGKLDDNPVTLSKSEDLTGKKATGAANKHVSTLGGTSPLRCWKDFGSLQSTDVARTKCYKKLPYDSGFFSRKSFRDLGCNDMMVESLKKQSFIRPSHIQSMVYSPILQGKSCIIADQSGSGKTLAYLAPVVQRLREEELSGLGKSSSRSPRVVILAPTAELASQVLHNCRSMAKHGVPFRSVVATGGFRQKTQVDSLEHEVDVLIATPGRFLYLLQEGYMQLNNLKCVVLDEVDILFSDEDSEQVLQRLISSAPMSVQYLFVTATLPLDVYHKLIEAFPDCQVLMGPGVHRTSSRLDEVLVDCSGEDGEEKIPDIAFQNKKNALLQLVEGSPVYRTIIFCNKIETCRKVENALKRFDRQGIQYKILPFHAALATEQRLSNLQEFLKSYTKEPMFLICTDRASRGIDFANVEHVVLFDFPRDPSEYVRRVGRTARGVAGSGKSFVFVVGKQVSMARRIIERNKKGHPLHDVPNAYELQR